MEGQIEFTILGLVKNPLPGLISLQSQNVEELSAVSKRLDEIKSNWRSSLVESNIANENLTKFTLFSANLDYGISPIDITNTEMSQTIREILVSEKVDELITRRQELINTQEKVRLLIKEEEDSNCSDEAKAEARRHDYGPAIKLWVRFHIRKGLVKEILDAAKEGSVK